MKEIKTLSTKMTMPKKDVEETETVRAGQGRPALDRYRLQVDRQTKASYPSHDTAHAAGAAIKKAHPLVQVTIYDAKESAITVL
jgi:hypothetical protein